LPTFVLKKEVELSLCQFGVYHVYGVPQWSSGRIFAHQLEVLGSIADDVMLNTVHVMLKTEHKGHAGDGT